MSDELVIFGFDTSNNFKVRVALNYKGIPFVFNRIDPGDRSTVLELSGQPLTPMIVHGNVVLFDSSAIIRYLEANFLDTPRLFPPDRNTIREIERWETFARGPLAEPVLIVVGQRIAGVTDEAGLVRAAEAFAAVAKELEEHLAERDWLVGDQMTAADVFCGPVVFRSISIGAFETPSDLPRVHDWADRVMAYDSSA